MTTETIRFRVTGRVQGVSFRAWTQAEAEAQGLSGWVRNREDGSVEGLASGAADRIATFLHRLNDGPGAARVTDVQSEHADETPPDGFQVRG